jgi:DNA repair ATPase RecN
MEKQLCNEKHKRIDERLDVHDTRLNEHARRIDQLSEDSREYKVQIRNLCKDIGSLVTTIRWFMGLLIGAFISFFFYAVQQGIFK